MISLSLLLYQTDRVPYLEGRTQELFGRLGSEEWKFEYRSTCLRETGCEGRARVTLGTQLEEVMKFETYGNCFVCGGNNPGGLRLQFEIDQKKRTLKTRFVATPVFQGYDGVVHGGIISTLLDEAMAKLAYELGYNTVTASLEVRFKRPAPILEPLLVYGEIIETNPRLVKAVAQVTKEDGTILATGTSTLMRQKI